MKNQVALFGARMDPQRIGDSQRFLFHFAPTRRSDVNRSPASLFVLCKRERHAADRHPLLGFGQIPAGLKHQVTGELAIQVALKNHLLERPFRRARPSADRCEREDCGQDSPC